MLRRLKKELRDIEADKLAEYTAAPLVEGDLVGVWKASIIGPIGSPYEGFVVPLDMTFPTNYPFKPMRVVFRAPMMHPNISLHGHVSFHLLSHGWSPAFTILKILASLQCILATPDEDNPMCPNMQMATWFEDARKNAREHLA